jgi:hypothetical protein
LIALWLGYALNQKLSLKLKVITIFILCSLMPILPWAVRNYRIYHMFIPLTTSSGHNLYSGNNEKTVAYFGGYDTPPMINENIPTLFAPQADAFLRKKAINFMLVHPNKTLLSAKDKFINMWQPYYSNTRRISKAVMIFSYLPFIILGLAGIFITLKSSKITVLSLLIICFYAILHMFTLSGIRYRYPLMPLFIIYTSFVVYRLFARLNFRLDHDE